MKLNSSVRIQISNLLWVQRSSKCSSFHRCPSLTCIHAAPQLDEALEGEVGDVWGPPCPGLRVKALLLLVLHHLLQPRARLKAQSKEGIRGHEHGTQAQPCLCEWDREWDSGQRRWMNQACAAHAHKCDLNMWLRTAVSYLSVKVTVREVLGLYLQ